MKWYCAAASFIFFTNLTPLFFLSKETEQINQKDFTSFSSDDWERKYMILPGSNGIMLNTGSAIKFPEDFSIRLESLTGEAIFENITFGKAAATLPTPFGADLLFDNDSQMKCRFTTNLDWREELDKVLEASTKFRTISSGEKNSNIYFI